MFYLKDTLVVGQFYTLMDIGNETCGLVIGMRLKILVPNQNR